MFNITATKDVLELTFIFQYLVNPTVWDVTHVPPIPEAKFCKVSILQFELKSFYLFCPWPLRFWQCTPVRGPTSPRLLSCGSSLLRVDGIDADIVIHDHCLIQIRYDYRSWF